MKQDKIGTRFNWLGLHLLMRLWFSRQRILWRGVQGVRSTIRHLKHSVTDIFHAPFLSPSRLVSCRPLHLL